MSIANSSAARRAGFKINDRSVADSAAISMAKIGTRTLRVGLPATIFHGSGTSVDIDDDGIFPVFVLPDANTGVLYTSFRLPAEWVASNDVTVDIYWKTSDVTGNVKFSVALAAKIAGETNAASDTQTVTTTVNATASKVNKSSVSFAGSLLAAGDLIGISITRDPADAADTLGSDINFIGADFNFTGRG